MTLLIISIYMFILIYLCLPEVDLEEGQNYPRPHIPPTSENLWIFVNLCTNSIVNGNFCTSTRNNLYPVSYGRLHPPHPQPSNQYTIGQPYLMDIVTIMQLCVMQISWLASFLLFKNKVTLQLLGDCIPQTPCFRDLLPK